MKLSVKSSKQNITQKDLAKNSSVKKVKKSIVKKTKSSHISKMTHSTKRYGKQILRDILLSKVFHVFFKVSAGIVIFYLVSHMVYSHFSEGIANDIVVSKSEIIDRISKLTTLPNEAPDAIVRVEDSETLKKQNDFYVNVKSGDYIVMYPKLAVIYDLRNNTIVALKKSE
jgi:hypothetical protein